MNMIKSTFKLTMILYLCVALSGVFLLSASARITPKEGDEETTLITIVKGDTLWDLCQEHLKDPLRWRELSKYNDFSNPHLIYPGEKLRIPLAMMNGIIEEKAKTVEIEQEELEALRAELEESEATREKLSGKVNSLNASIDKLKSQIEALEDSLKSQKALLDAFKKASNDAATDVKKVVRSTKNALQKDLADLHGHLDSSNGMLSSLQKELKATQEHIGALQSDVKTALAKIEANQKGINDLKMMLEAEKGVHEEVSSSKRALVFVTTVAAGIGWFVLNTIGGRSAE